MAFTADVTEEAPVKTLFVETFKARGHLDILADTLLTALPRSREDDVALLGLRRG